MRCERRSVVIYRLGRAMRLVAVVAVFAVVLVSCAEGLSGERSGADGTSSAEPPAAPVPGLVVERCVAGGTAYAAGPEGYDTLDAALDAAAEAAGLDVALLRAEDRSDIWIAGTSDDPVGVIELRRPDSSDTWFIDTATSCDSYDGQAPTIPTELASGEITALPVIVLVEGAQVGDIYTTGLAGDAAAFADLWHGLGLVGTPPVIDFNSRVVLYFGAVESSSCPLGPMEGLVYNHGNESIHPLISSATATETTDSGVKVCTERRIRRAAVLTV